MKKCASKLILNNKAPINSTAKLSMLFRLFTFRHEEYENIERNWISCSLDRINEIESRAKEKTRTFPPGDKSESKCLTFSISHFIHFFLFLSKWQSFTRCNAIKHFKTNNMFWLLNLIKLIDHRMFASYFLLCDFCSTEKKKKIVQRKLMKAVCW